MGARFGDDFKRTGIFVGEFFGQLGGAEEFGFDETCCPVENGGGRDHWASADLW